MEKGLGVIVARQDKHGYSTDSICNCDASFFSISQPVVLQTADFKSVSADRILYVCGHGNKFKRTISGYHMHAIAKMFKDAGYDGAQKIVIASCYGLCKKHKKTLADELIEAFKSIDIDAKCEAIATGTSLVWEESGRVVCKDLPALRGQNRAFITIQSAVFKAGAALGINKDCLHADIKDNAADVQQWNKMAYNGKFKGAEICTSNVIKVADAFIAACVATLCIYLAGMYEIPMFQLNYFVCIWLLSEILMVLEIPIIGSALLAITFVCGPNWFMTIRLAVGIIAFLASFVVGVLRKLA